MFVVRRFLYKRNVQYLFTIMNINNKTRHINYDYV